MLLHGKISGRGEVTVTHDDNSKTIVSNDNLILDTFFAWMVSKNNINKLIPTCKVGLGASPSLPGMGGLESPMTLNSGSWPTPKTTLSPISTIVNGDTVVATVQFDFVFTKGQVNGNLAEYGLDVNGATSAGDTTLHTRVTTKDENGNQAAITVKVTDQLTISYVLEFRAPLAIAPIVVPVNYGGSTIDHTFQFYWNDHSTFLTFLNLCGGYNTGTAAPTLAACNVAAIAGNFETQYGASGNAGPVVVTTLEADAIAINYKFGSAQGNQSSGVNMILCNGNTRWWRLGITPPLPKVAGKELSFTLRRSKR